MRLVSNPEQMVDLTICIVNYNTRDFLANCLASIYQQSKDIDFQVVVVDNNSSDGSQDMVKERFPQVKLIHNQENLGFTKANNQAITQTHSKYVLLLNSDTLLVSAVLSEMKTFLENHPEAGAVSCRILRPDRSIQPTSYSQPTLWLLLFQLLGLKHLLPKETKRRRLLARVLGSLLKGNVRSYLEDTEFSRPKEVDVISGACLFFRRELIEEVGLFDENIFFGPDDLDWCLRLRKKGWKIFVLPTPGIVHYVGQTSQKTLGKVSPAQYQGLFYFYVKHFGIRAKIFLATIVPVILSAKCLPLLLTFPFASAKGRAERIKLAGDYLQVARLATKA